MSMGSVNELQEKMQVNCDTCPSFSGEIEKTRRRRGKAKVDDGPVEVKNRKMNDDQLKFLEMNFREDHTLDTDRKLRLATVLGLGPRQVVVWFQNRRARWRIQQLEEENLRLKSQHENEISSLKGKLEEAERRKIELLSAGGEEGGGLNPSSVENYGHPDIGDQSVDELLYVNEYYDYFNDRGFSLEM